MHLHACCSPCLPPLLVQPTSSFGCTRSCALCAPRCLMWAPRCTSCSQVGAGSRAVPWLGRGAHASAAPAAVGATVPVCPCCRQWQCVWYHCTTPGNYRVLPSVIEEELVQPGQRLERPGELSEAAAAEQRQEATRRLDFLLRSKLLAVGAAALQCAAAAASAWQSWSRGLALACRHHCLPTMCMLITALCRRASCQRGCVWCVCEVAPQSWLPRAASTPLASRWCPAHGTR